MSATHQNDRMNLAGQLVTSVGRRGIRSARRVGDAVLPRVERVACAAAGAGRTVVGQARSAVRRTSDQAGVGTREVVGQVGAQGEQVATAASRAGRTVVGQGRSAASRTSRQAAVGAREVAGQVDAQGERVADVVGKETDGALRQAERAASERPGPGVPYEEWTRQQLYERAQELEIEGRASMNKAELIDALRS